MSEFKYACPVCGQHIKCDSSQAGTVMTCPTCFQKIIVPQAPASGDQKLILTGIKVGERSPQKVPETNPAFIPVSKGSSGAAVVVVILIFIGVVVAFVYHGTLFRTGPASGTNQVAFQSASTFVAPDGSVNVALRKPTFASSQENGKPPAFGNDGDIETRWCALNGTVPQWWMVNLGGAATVTNAQIVWEHAAAYQYLIEVSSNSVDWTVVADKSANTEAAQFTSDDFSARAKYMRVVVTGLQQGSWASFYEFRALGSISNNDK